VSAGIQEGGSAGRIFVSAGLDEKAAPYVEALRAVGVPAERIVVLTPGARTGVPTELMAGAAGLVLSGGVDVAPERYGEAPRPDSRLELYPERDVLEWELLAAARERRVPVWCVCRGLQVANVFLGGSLWQDLPTQLPGPVAHEVSVPVDSLAHAVRVTAPETHLGERLSREMPLVNSRHHQAIKDLAPGLAAVAFSPDGLVEAIEGVDLDGGEGVSGGWWLRGVQWHPENLIAMGLHRSLWADFVSAANGDAGVRP
jgi:putative glutamine amidotransferase